jgi:glycosyltransferase involved in cell wall biosynthesis
LPYLLYKGDQVRTFHFIRELARRGHEIDLVSFVESNEEAGHLATLKDYCSEIRLVKNPPWWASMKMAFFSFSPTPFQVLYYRSQRLPFILSGLMKKHDYDVVHLVLARMMEYAPCFPDLPLVVDHIDALSLNMKRRCRNETNPAKRVLFGWEWLKLKGFEEKTKDCHDHALITSSVDAAAGGFPRTSIVSIGVDTERFRPTHSPVDIDVLFTGNMGYFPNVNAALFFCDRVLPAIKEEMPGVRFCAAGVNPVRAITDRHDGKTVTIPGYVDDMVACLNRAKVYAAPMQSGSGVQFKILEAMSCGLPVVTTSIGNEGIDATPGTHLLVADNADDFAAQIRKLLENTAYREKLGRAAREFICRRFSWSAQAEKLEQAYLKAIHYKRAALSQIPAEPLPAESWQSANWS